LATQKGADHGGAALAIDAKDGAAARCSTILCNPLLDGMPSELILHLPRDVDPAEAVRPAACWRWP